MSAFALFESDGNPRPPIPQAPLWRRILGNETFITWAWILVCVVAEFLVLLAWVFLLTDNHHR